MHYRILFTAMFIWSCLSWSLAAAQEAPLFRVNEKTYTFSDLTGKPETELRKHFDSSIKEMSDAELEKQLFPAQAAELRTVPPRSRHDFLRDAVWANCKLPLVHDALATFVLAAISEAIIREHGIDPDEYFDHSVIR